MAAPKKILIVEDDEFLATLLRNRLVREGFDVTVAGDGDAALDDLRKNKPDLMLLDIILPKKLGFEVMEELQKDPKINKTPFMIISNLGQDSDIARAKELGAVDYFVKARIMIDDFIIRIKRFLQVSEPTPVAATPSI